MQLQQNGTTQRESQGLYLPIESNSSILKDQRNFLLKVSKSFSTNWSTLCNLAVVISLITMQPIFWQLWKTYFLHVHWTFEGVNMSNLLNSQDFTNVLLKGALKKVLFYIRSLSHHYSIFWTASALNQNPSLSMIATKLGVLFAIIRVNDGLLTWSNTSSCSSSFSIRALVSPLEPQVVVPTSHSHSHCCQHHYSSRWTQAGPWGSHSHERADGKHYDEGGQVAPHGKNSRSASPAAAGSHPFCASCAVGGPWTPPHVGPPLIPPNHSYWAGYMPLILMNSHQGSQNSPIRSLLDIPTPWQSDSNCPTRTRRVRVAVGGGGASTCSHPHIAPYPRCKPALLFAFKLHLLSKIRVIILQDILVQI